MPAIGALAGGLAYGMELVSLLMTVGPKAIDFGLNLKASYDVLTAAKDEGREPSKADFAELRRVREAYIASIDAQIARDKAELAQDENQAGSDDRAQP